MPNASYLKDHFFNEGRILESHALWIVRTAMAVLRREPNMVLVSSPITGELVVVCRLGRVVNGW